MPSETQQTEPLVLGFDTSAAHCAAALLRGDQVLASRLEETARGQADRLMPLLEEILAEAQLSWGVLDAIGVGIGPGNFTGIRISVAAARGLALGLGVPAIGVDGFAARAEALGDANLLPAVPAPRDQAYVAPPGEAPRLMPRPEADALARGAGHALSCEATPPGLAVAIARHAGKLLQSGEVLPPPAPLYIRPADATPASDQPPVLLDGDPASPVKS